MNHVSKIGLKHNMAITRKGYDAMLAGQPRVPPYSGYKPLVQRRNKHWLEGWDCAYREELERRANQPEEDDKVNQMRDVLREYVDNNPRPVVFNIPK